MITDCIGADTRSLHVNWLHCENGLPTEITSDRGKLFLSKFWRALHKLTNVSLKMSSAYHPETDGTSERTNPINQCIRFLVERDQGWVKALPRATIQLPDIQIG